MENYLTDTFGDCDVKRVYFQTSKFTQNEQLAVNRSYISGETKSRIEAIQKSTGRIMTPQSRFCPNIIFTPSPFFLVALEFRMSQIDYPEIDIIAMMAAWKLRRPFHDHFNLKRERLLLKSEFTRMKKKDCGLFFKQTIVFLQNMGL